MRRRRLPAAPTDTTTTVDPKGRVGRQGCHRDHLADVLAMTCPTPAAVSAYKPGVGDFQSVLFVILALIVIIIFIIGCVAGKTKGVPTTEVKSADAA